MKQLLLIFTLVSSLSAFSQLRSNFAQYMLNQGVINPGYCDVETRYSGTLSVRKQWVTQTGTPLTVFANGHYQLTRNHAIGGTISNDRIGDINSFEIAANYTFHAWLTKKLALGLGMKVGYQQTSTKNDYVYFDHSEIIDPSLNNLWSAGINMGFGMSLQSKNFLFGISSPYVFNNRYANVPAYYEANDNHIYSTIGYKIRFSDNFILFPSAMLKGAPGAPPSMSFDGHVLVSQMLWLGGGYRSDNTVAVSAGVFLDRGLRIVYTYENSSFGPHTRLESSHEISLNYARTLRESPFNTRQYRKRNGKLFKKPGNRTKWRHLD
jgi:type IX secretion system PorP/SprF family membrane protein